MIRAVRTILALAMVPLTLAGCTCPEEMMMTETRCCDDGMARVVRSECLSGEISLPVDRCMETPDAGTADPCGDGILDMSEQCEPSLTSAECPGRQSCLSCQCVDLCGDDNIDDREECERNPDCGGATNIVCRGCGCFLDTLPVTFSDVVGDIAPGADQNMFFFDFEQVQVLLAGARREFEVTLRGALGAHTEDLRVCIVDELDGSEASRICWTQTAMFQEMISYSVTGQPPSTPPEVRVTEQARGFKLTVPEGSGINFDSARSFYWTLEHGAVLADRMPDAGSISYTEILGRP